MSEENKKQMINEPQEEFKDDRPASQKDETEQNTAGYKEWSLKDLRTEARRKEIAGYQNKDKEELVNKLTEVDSAE